jgi:hypothetical protein
VTNIRCSKYMWFITLFMLVFPITYLVFASLIFELHSQGILSVVLSPLFYLASFFWIISGSGIRRIQKLAWYTFLAAQLFITYLNALNLVNYSHSDYKSYAFILTVLIQSYVYLVVYNELRVPYLFPRIKWWESGLAGMFHLPAEIMHVSSAIGVSNGQILDISGKGCFFKSPNDFQPFEKVKVLIEQYGHKVDVAGIVVWNAESTVTHPKGVGIRFQGLDRKRRRRLSVIARRFKKNKENNHVAKKLPA